MKARHVRKLLVRTILTVVVLALLAPGAASQPSPEPRGEAEDMARPVDPSYAPSDSPWLWLPEDERNWPTMEPVGPAAPVEVDDPDAIEVYEIATGEITVIPSAEGQVAEESDLVEPPFEGLLPPGTPPESVLPPDDRSRVTNTTTFPWRTIVKLQLTFPDSATGGCSGAIIPNTGFHVLTAGHCVYSHDHGGWATSIKVIPGYDNGYMPYNYAWATRLRSYAGWTSSGKTEHDWAMITLDREVGDFTGWMGRRTASSSSWIYTTGLNVAGYPGDKCSGNCMYYDFDDGHSASTYNHWYRMDTAGGMSGSPVWLKVGDDRWILTVHTCGTGGCGISGKGVNHGTRLNNDKYDRITTWRSEDTAPIDRADLIDDGQSKSGFSPTKVARGVTSLHLWSDVRNVGTAASGGFTVAYYASTNTTISSSDYLIGTDSVSSISPFSSRDSDRTGTVPASIPDGTYWVGWIIDSGGAVTEFDETNNTAYKTAYKLEVCTLPVAPTLVSPANSGRTCDTTPKFDWSSVRGATSYRIQVDDSSTFRSPEINTTTTASDYTPRSALACGTYYWRVGATSSCGDGSWSAVWRFTIECAPATPSGPSPAAGASGVSINANLDWANAASATSYDVYFGTSTTPPFVANVAVSSYDLPTLSANTIYYWKIVAKNGCGNTSGPVWRFQTGGGANNPPENTNLWPDHGGRAAGRAVNFTATYRDRDGWRDLRQVFLHIGSTMANRNNCRLRYDVRRNEMYLLNNTGNAWLGGYTPGSARVIRNRQCTLRCAKSAVVPSGRVLRVKWNLVFRTGFRGRKNSYMQCVDMAGAMDPWEQMGTWRVQ